MANEVFLMDIAAHPITVVDNGDGTYCLMTIGSIHLLDALSSSIDSVQIADDAAGDLAAINIATAAVNAKGFKRITKEFTRPTDTTPYSALDCLGDNAPGPTTQNLPLAGRVVGGSGSIVRADMKTDNLSWTNAITIVIYDLAVPAAWIADNAAFDEKYVDAANIIGKIAFPAFAKDATGASGSFVTSLVDELDIPYICAVASQNLYFQTFLPSGTPTPASGQKFMLNIGVIRD